MNECANDSSFSKVSRRGGGAAADASVQERSRRVDVVEGLFAFDDVGCLFVGATRGAIADLDVGVRGDDVGVVAQMSVRAREKPLGDAETSEFWRHAHVEDVRATRICEGVDRVERVGLGAVVVVGGRRARAANENRWATRGEDTAVFGVRRSLASLSSRV